jgi:hypothetical protein
LPRSGRAAHRGRSISLTGPFPGRLSPAVGPAGPRRRLRSA